MHNQGSAAPLRARSCAVSVICGLLAACGGTALRTDEQASAGSSGAPVEFAGAGGDDSGGSAGSAGSAGRSGGGAAGEAGSECSPGLPSAAEIAATPRADQNLELLALRISGGIIADQGTYDRVVRDVGAIRAQAQSVAGIQYFPRDDGKSLYLEPEAATYAAMRAGQYHDWDCFNQTYVVTDTLYADHKPPFTSTVLLTLKGIYDIATVSAQYGALAGVKASSGGIAGGDGPTICVTRENALWHYVFDQAGGDCPAGCTEHTYYHFTTTAEGAVSDLGQIPGAEESPYTSNDACG